MFTEATTASVLYTEYQQDANWDRLPESLKDYFRHLADGDPERTGQAFYEDTVPPELQDKPELVEKYLNGHEELGVSDKDWSHDVSKHNGGSDSADNGRFEDASVNRSRGAENSTQFEQDTADSESAEDVRTLLRDFEETGDATLWAEAVELAGSAGELALDFFAPFVGAGVATKAVVDRCEATEVKVGLGVGTFGTTFWALTTPIGQAAIAGYLGYRLTKRGVKLWQKHVAPHLKVADSPV